MRSLSIFITNVTVLVFLFCILSCTDTTGTLGADMMPSADVMKPWSREFLLKSSTVSAKRVLCRTSVSYLGRFTDPETNSSIKADFVTQFYNPEVGNTFPDSVIDNYITNVDVYLYLSGYLGDTLAPMKVSVYKLDKSIDSSNDYYTDINLDEYIHEDSMPLATCVLTLADNKVSYEDRNASSYVSKIHFSLPREYGQQILDAYRRNKSVLANTYSWLNSGLDLSKGLYFKLDGGDGAIAYIYNGSLDLNFRFPDSGLNTDTVGTVRFSSTEEVIQVTRFENSSNIDSLKNDTTCTYIKSPAGLFTELTLPVDSIEEIADMDSINSASLTLLRMNTNEEYNFRINAPKNLLLVRLNEYEKGFFESYQVADNKTSYLTTFSTSNNTYTFNNIARLVATCIQEKKAAMSRGEDIEQINPNYNKVLLIPVETTYDSSNNLVKLNHDFSVSCARLVGGNDTPKVKMNIIHTKFVSNSY